MSGLTIGQFIKEFGTVGMGDVVFVEKTDHDAGHKPANENWFWDSTGYNKYLLWTRSISNRTGLPIVGWQVAEGNMSHPDTKKRDNAAETFLASPKRWYDAGFIGILFGAGNSDCANYLNDNDNDWFVNNFKAYNQNPWKFPATATKPQTLVEKNRTKFTIVKSANGIFLKGVDDAQQIEIRTLSGRTLARSNNPLSEIVIGENVECGIYILLVKSRNELTADRFVFTR